jgi:hypothetical protein
MHGAIAFAAAEAPSITAVDSITFGSGPGAWSFGKVAGVLRRLPRNPAGAPADCCRRCKPPDAGERVAMGTRMVCPESEVAGFPSENAPRSIIFLLAAAFITLSTLSLLFSLKEKQFVTSNLT